MIRVAVIGNGEVVRYVHLPAIVTSEHMCAVAIAANDAAGLRATAAEHDIPSWWTDWRTMLREVRPDVVVVATPDACHAEMAGEALRAGAHVLVEKPAVTTAWEGERLLDVARASGRTVAVNMTLRLLPLAEKAARLMAGMVRPSFRFDYVVAPPMAAPRGGRQLGLVQAIGVHAVDFPAYLLGDRVARVASSPDRADRVRLGVQMRGGSRGECALGYDRAGLRACLRAEEGERRMELTLGPGDAWAVASETEEVACGSLWSDMVTASAIADLAAALRHRRPPCAGLDEHLDLLAALDAACA